MPSAILHLTHGELLASDAAVPTPLRAAMSNEVHFTHLGSVLPDLPFYTNILPMTLGYWLEWRAENCPMALRLHSVNPEQFAWHVLRQCAEPSDLLGREERLAMLGGFFAHIALDLELHPLVNWCARRDVITYGGHESHHHRLAEKYHSLFFHVDLEGKDCLGTLWFFNSRAKVLEEQGLWQQREKHPAIRWIADTFAVFGPDSPSPRLVSQWMRTFRRFSFLISLPIAEKNAQRLGHRAHRQRYFENAYFRFDEFWQRGYLRSVELLNLAYEIVTAGDFSEDSRESFLAAARISDLSYPPERHLPPLPTSLLGRKILDNPTPSLTPGATVISSRL